MTPNSDQLGFLSGFGRDRFDSIGNYDQLMHVTVPFVKNPDCEIKFPKLHAGMLCAGGDGKNSCTGDSGINLRPSKLLPAFERNIVQHTFDFLHLFQTV